MNQLQETIHRVNNIGMEFIRDGVVYRFLDKWLSDNAESRQPNVGIGFKNIRPHLSEDAVIADITGVESGVLDICDGTEVKCNNNVSLLNMGHSLLPVTEIHIPNTVRCIENYSFTSFGITECTLPNNMLHLDVGVFDSCSNLQRVTLPDNLKELPACTLYRCYSLEHVDLPPALESIGLMSLSRSGLKELILPPSVRKLDSASVTHCKQLQYIQLNEGLREIGDRAFNGSCQLEEITIPRSINGMAPTILHECPKLRAVYMPKEKISALPLTGLPQKCEVIAY